jgi:serine phosphatase RsbU (regulator of sigma subunit)
MNVGTLGNASIALAYLVVGALVLFLGIIIFREAPRERANRATAMMLFSGGIGSVLGAVGIVLNSMGPNKAGANDLLRSFNYVWELFFPSLLYFACVFPKENRLFRRIPFASLWIFAPHLFHLILMILQMQGALWGQLAAKLAQNPTGATVVEYGRLPFELIFRFHQILFSLVNLAYIAAALPILWLSWRRSENSRIRAQVRTIFYGLAACAGCYAIAVPIPTLFNTFWPPAVRSTLIVAALIVGSVAIAYSMVRYRFLDANLIARKSILYSVTLIFVLGVYMLIVRRLDALIETVADVDTTIFQTAFLMLALVLFQPLFSWLEEMLDRYFLRDKGDFRTIVRRMSGEMLAVLDLSTLAEKLLSALREGLPARTTVLLVAPERRQSTAWGFGGRVDLEAIGAIPRDALMRLLDDTDLLRGEDARSLAKDRALEGPLVPLLDTEPYLILPLRYGGNFLGLVALGRKITETRYTAAETSLLATLANQMSVAVTTTFLHRDSLEKTILEEELAVARRIQQQFLPNRLPLASGFTLAGLNAPSKAVGGDYYDTVELGQGDYLVAIADVAGKGVPAALLASMVQAAIRTSAPDRKPVGELMGRLNRLVHEATPDDRFATCILVEVKVDGLGISFSNAGHNYPILRSANGICRSLDAGGIPLGIQPGFQYSQSRAALRPGDALIMYTDGITDARNRLGEDFGEGRLLELVERLPERLSADEIIRAIADEVTRFSDGADQMDDITLVALKANSATVVAWAPPP